LEGYTQNTQNVAALKRARDHGLSVHPGQDIEYVAVDDGKTPPLVYVGETSAFTGRLRRHEDTFGGDVLFSVGAPEGMDAKHKRTEVETDLIRVHYLTTGESPTAQFGK